MMPSSNLRRMLSLLLLVHGTMIVGSFPVFTEYGAPQPDWAALDLDQRAIRARTGLVSAQGLSDAQQVYEQGGSDNSFNTSPGTIQELSTTNVYTNHTTFEAFQSFYGGTRDYADQWLLAALGGKTIQLGSRKINFSTDVEGRARAVSRGTVVLNVWMAVASALEEAVAIQCSGTTSAQTQWDRAFALYTGSLAESDLPLGGYFLYGLAQEFGAEFGRCRLGEEAPVNTALLQQFIDGRDRIAQNDCAALQQTVPRMVALLKVPLIQAALRNMYAVDLEDDHRLLIQGETAAFGAAVAPILSNCSSGSADTVYQDMTLNDSKGSFEVVKSAMERHYGCLGVTCQDIGGIITHKGDGYVKRGAACDGVQPVSGAGYSVQDETSDHSNGAPRSPDDSSGDSREAILIGILVVVVVVITVAAFVTVRRKRRRSKNNGATSLQKDKATGQVTVTMNSGTERQDGSDDTTTNNVETGEFT